MQKTIGVLDTTLRDGEQTRGVSFSAQEKLSIAKMLLKDVKLDRLEAASAKVSEGELESVKGICDWAKSEGFLEKVEVLGFVDKTSSVGWLAEARCRKLNLLAKGSERHCRMQLGKEPEEHYRDAVSVIDYANEKGIGVNVYLEDWSNGMKNSPEYTLAFAEELSKTKMQRLMLPDTLGILSPSKTTEFISKMGSVFPLERTDFHAHNDYGLATANSLAAIEAGVSCVHTTVNGLGERTGNTPLAELVACINDLSGAKCNVDEKALVKASRFLEQISGKRIPSNKPITGENVFTQTAGIHADGDAKGNLYASALFPERFGRKREYALGKLSGKASLEHNLKELNIELTPEEKKLVLARIISLGDRKENITPEDLPFIIADVLKTPLSANVKIVSCEISSSLSAKPTAKLNLLFAGKECSAESGGNGGYDAFMNALKTCLSEKGFEIPLLKDYFVSIPPGGKTSALVETTITWLHEGKEFRTIGVDSDQVMAAVKATEKMLNLVSWKK